MAIVGGFDIHRKQVTFDYLDTVTGQVRRGRIDPACRLVLRDWLAARFGGRDDVTFAVEGCTGWRFVVEELARAGVTALLAEPADTAHLRGPKKHAKTDKTDSRHLRVLAAEGRLPLSWIPPEQVLELRALLQLYRDLAEERTAWSQRIHATLFHQGVPAMAHRLDAAGTRAALRDGEAIGLSPAGAQAVAVALGRMEDLEAEMAPLRAQIAAFTRRQPACRALQHKLFGVGPLVAAVVWAFLGDARRFSSSAQAVRHCGLDVTVYSSDDKRTPGCRTRDRRSCAGRCSRPGSRGRGPAPPTTATTPTSRRGSTPAAPPCRWPASWPAAPTTSCAPSATRPTPPFWPDGETHAGGRGSPHAADAPWPSPRGRRPRCLLLAAPQLTGRGQPRKTGAATPPAGPPHRSSCRRDRSCLADRGKAGRPPHPHTPDPQPTPEAPMT
jgi:transposase